jgi:hypothetical protein
LCGKADQSKVILMTSERRAYPWHQHAKQWIPDHEVLVFALVSMVSILSLILYMRYP